MWTIATVVNAVFGAILAPFKGLHPWFGLLAVSVVTGIVMLLIFGKTSNQKAIRHAKGKLRAHIAEIWLFRDDLLEMLLATVKVLGHTSRYFVHSLRPLIFIMIPVILIMVMLGARYEHRPFLPEEEALCAVTVDDVSWTLGEEVALIAPEGVAVTSSALRIPHTREIEWRIRALQPGRYALTVRTPRGEVTKAIVVSAHNGPLDALAPARGRAFSGHFLQFPVEPPLTPEEGVRAIEIRGWPKRHLTVLGLEVHWLIAFFLLSLVAGFSVKGLFGVEV